MGMFDYYEPQHKRRCPKCQTLLSGWQGKDGPCGLFVWQQHKAAPVDQPVDEEFCLSKQQRDKMRLPETFGIYASCNHCENRVTAEGLTVDNVWRHTFLQGGDMIFPSGADWELAVLNIPVAEISRRRNIELEYWEEDGLGSASGFWIKLWHGNSVLLKELKHCPEHFSVPGPTVYIDMYDGLKYGHEKLLWGVLDALSLSITAVADRPSNTTDWQNEISERFRNLANNLEKR